MLFDSHKDVVSGKILVFGNILGFPGVNWAQKWTKTVNFGYVPFPLKHLFLKDCSATIFCSYERLPLVETLANSSHIWGRKGPEAPQKGPFHKCCIATKTFENL